MKKALIFFGFALVFAACKNSDQKIGISQSSATELSLKDSANFTSIQWLDSMHHDFGKITEGEVLEVSYRFKNAGSKPLIIANVHASCGCTIPETPKEPIAPGADGIIRAKFNSSHKVGPNKKEIYVTANTTPSTLHQLEFTVEVDKKAE